MNEDIITNEPVPIVEKKVPKLKKSFILAWSTQGLALSASYILLGYLTLYATDVMGLNAATVGIAFMISKFFDGFTDMVAGVLIDKTHTRFGKARPYSLAIVGYYACIGLVFSAPAMGQFAGIIYLFVLYTLIYAVFCTLFSCAEPVYMSRTLEDPRQSMTLLSFVGVIAMFPSIAFGIIIPQWIARIGVNPAEWSKMAWTLAIPLALVGIVRFFVIKERKNAGQITSDKENVKNNIPVKEMTRLLIKNKYILILSVLVCIAYLGSGLTNAIGSYYAKYIFGDVGVGSIMTLTLVPMIFMLALIPVLARKFTLKRCINVTMILAIIGSLIRLIDVKSVPLGFIGGCLSVFAFPAFYGFATTMVLDCMDYGQWKFNKRVEGTLASVQSLMNKVGTAIATGMMGVMLSIAGYDGLAVTQSASANRMIIALTTVIPVVFYIIFMIIFHFYDLESKMPGIRAQLNEGKKES
jgi:Na+/melibiose symporter-like transporter